MDSLYNPTTYPTQLREQIVAEGAVAVDVANRWLLGWPGRVKALIARGDYLEVLKEQATQERALFESPNAPTHLARHEIVQEYGLTMEPPAT